MITAYLETLTSMQQECFRRNQKLRGGALKKFKYCCFEEFVLKHGRAYSFRPLPEKIERGEMKQCFYNAYHTVIAHKGLTYVEGYAAGIIPVLHAWCVDQEGYVIDPTWTEGVEYYGVALNITYVSKILLEREKYGVLDNWECEFPLLSGRHTVDDFAA